MSVKSVTNGCDHHRQLHARRTYQTPKVNVSAIRNKRLVKWPVTNPPGRWMMLKGLGDTVVGVKQPTAPLNVEVNGGS